MLEKLKNKRTLMIAGAALLAIILLWVGYLLLFGSSQEDEETQIEGEWAPSVIPALPPIVFNPQTDWGAPAVKLSQLNAAYRAKVKAGIRIEKGKSPTFDNELILIKRVETDKSVAESPRIQVSIRYNGERVIDSARMDILFLDNRSTVLGRRAINPLVVSGSMFGDRIQPLQPSELRALTVDATQAPLGWVDQVAAEIIYYQFAP